ncbi:MAG: hypothetical protein Q9207_005483 [Kuettlingeria erythrocarpa]
MMTKSPQRREGAKPSSSSTSLPYPVTKRQKLTGRAFYESIGSPKYILAPMVDQSEFAWRLLTRSFLPLTQHSSLLAYTPMFHARLFKGTQTFRDHHFQPIRTGLPSPLRDSSQPPPEVGEQPMYLDGHPSHDRPLVVQFCANDPDDLLQAAQHVTPYCDAVDLNLGCPQGIARKGHYGSFLQESPNLIHSLVSKLAKNLDIPVTAKMRILNTKEETLQYARLLLDAGASWIAVHGRRREQKGHKTGLADWSIIRYLRDMLPDETVIFANGNVLGHQELERCLQATGADGVMSAEGNLCDPGIFAGDEERTLGEQRGEYWTGRDGKGGWRMDAVMRRYLDILYRHVLEKEPPNRTPLFVLGRKTIESTPSMVAVSVLSSEPTLTTFAQPLTDDQTSNSEPPAKKRKHNRSSARTTSPNLLAVQAHLFHLLRPLVSKHTHIRDKLARARARAGDMETYEEILSLIEDVTKQGLLDYESDPTQFLVDIDAKGEESRGDDDNNEEESSVKARRACKRPWWVCQPYVRPLPKEALEKGSLSLGKKAKRKLMEEEAPAERRLEARDEDQAEGQVEGKSAREERDAEDGVPREEMPKQAMVCG